MPTHRKPAGEAGGSLGGMYPDAVSVGAPPLMGWSLWDDFIRTAASPDIGESRLTQHNIGAPATVAAQTPSANTEQGILQIDTTAGAAQFEGGTVGVPVAPGIYAAGLPSGVTYVTKVRVLDTADISAWSGFADAHARVFNDPAGADFIGVWMDSSVSANWYGVVFDGTTWTTVDLGITADTTWQIFAFRMLPKNSATDTAYGLQFYTVDASGPLDWGTSWEPIGDLVQTGVLPTTAMTLVAGGVVTRLNALSRRMEIDFVGVGGRGRR